MARKKGNGKKPPTKNRRSPSTTSTRKRRGADPATPPDAGAESLTKRKGTGGASRGRRVSRVEAPKARGSKVPARAKGRRQEGSPRTPARTAVVPPAGDETLSDEERIESAKYMPQRRERVFEEERFLFPETYGVNRLRLVARDPEWLFAHWDIDPRSLADLKAEVGERSFALARLTLRVIEPGDGRARVVLLPEGARWWYVPADGSPRAYRAELGLTLPSGEFRRLAESGVVTTPRVGPSPERAGRVVSFNRVGDLVAETDRRTAAAQGPVPGPDARPEPEETRIDVSASNAPTTDGERGGASDVYRR